MFGLHSGDEIEKKSTRLPITDLQGILTPRQEEAPEPVGFQRVGRGLQQAEEVTVVKTAEEFQAAVVIGKEHIEIQAHLNLTSLKFVGEPSSRILLGEVPTSVQSIRVRC